MLDLLLTFSEMHTIKVVDLRNMLIVIKLL